LSGGGWGGDSRTVEQQETSDVDDRRPDVAYDDEVMGTGTRRDGRALPIWER
jgi:hypothetical protein